MNAKPGDLIVVETEHVGDVEREGEVLEVMEGDLGIRFRVKWRDGRETLLMPSAGSVRVVPKRKSSARRKTSAPSKRASSTARRRA
jgi:uncharacterized protein DUF1918